MTQIALIYADQRVGMMQMVGDDSDAAVNAAIAKLADQPEEWQRVTDEQAQQIRSARPRPEPGAQPVPAGASAMSEADRAALEAENARLNDQIAALGAEFEKFKANTEHNFSVMIERVAQKMLEVSPLPVEEKQQ